MPYVDETKVDAFNTFMAQKEATVLANKDLRVDNFKLRQEKKSVFSAAQKASLDKKLQGRAKDFLARLVSKIDELVGKIKTDKLKSQLLELKDMANEKISSMQ